MSITTPGTDDESLACLDVAVNLPAYVEASGQFRDHARDVAHPRSLVGRAKAKRATGWSDDQALVKAEVADDHLRCVAQVIATGLLPRTALYSLLRTSIEADAQAVWLLAPGCSAQERRQRRLTETAFGASAQLDIAAGRLPDLERRARLLAARGERAGLLRVWRTKHPAERLPTKKAVAVIARHRETLSGQAAKLFGDLKAGSLPRGTYLYRVLSGWAHADVLAQLRSRDIGEPTGPGHVNVTLQLDIPTLLACCSEAVGAHELMMAAYMEACGLDPKIWRESRTELSPILRPAWMDPDDPAEA
jgi:hypothetical protein